MKNGCDIVRLKNDISLVSKNTGIVDHSKNSRVVNMSNFKERKIMHIKLIKQISFVVCILSMLVFQRFANGAELPEFDLPHLVIPAYEPPAGWESMVSIPCFNDTDYKIYLKIISSNQEYEGRAATFAPPAPAEPHSQFDARTVIGFDPYVVKVTIAPDYLTELAFEIPALSTATEIRITESPKGSRNFHVWYTTSYRKKEKELRKREARTFMEAAHRKLGAATAFQAVGMPEPTYRDIGELALGEALWTEAAPIP